MSVGKQSFLEILRFDKKKYSVAYFLIFSCVIFENIVVKDPFSFSDILYAIFAVYCLLSSRSKSSYLKYYLYPIIFLSIALLDYYTFNASRMFMSQCRFVYNCSVFVIVFISIQSKENSIQNKIISTYIYVCVIFALFVILQFLSFYLLHYNLKFDFGSYQGQINHASLATPSFGVMYRTGGFFKEPSWFALFLAPALEISYRQNKIRELIICIVGLVLSTSSLGFLFIFVFIFFNFRSRNKKYIFYFVALVFVVYFLFPIAFDRLFEALSFEEDAVNSNDARVLIPFSFVLDSKEIPLFGMNIDYLFDSLFLNTFLFVLLAFGIIGLIVFLKMLYQRNNIVLTIVMVITVVVEGCYGRIDFWLALLATSVYCKYSTGDVPKKK